MSKFKFTSEMPDEHLFADIQTLNAFSDEQLSQLICMLLNYIIEKNIIYDDLPLSDEIYASLQDILLARVISLRIFRHFLKIKSVLYFFKAALRQNLSFVQVRDDLLTFGVQAEKANFIGSKWKAAFADMSRSMIGQTLSVNGVLDMDWRFGVTASNTELSSVGNTFLQLKLVLNKGNKIEHVPIELTLPQFYQFLHEMEKAKQNLEYFS